ncbi:MAG: CBS domain-containing protein [Anaerolineaceae bacterium]|nr:CBS domain-containing protein [Anaerolineaceae bacterium]
MITVTDLLKIKGHDVYTVSPDTPTLQALKLMAEKNIGAVLVLDGKKMAGILSERDVVRQIAAQDNCNLTQPVEQYMTELLYVVSPTQTIDDCMEMMTKKHIRHLPVMENEKLMGMISIGDVVRQLIADHESTIDNLEKYITGTGYGR